MATMAEEIVTEYSFHRYANIFPQMAPDEFRSLVDDINEFGLRDKIWLYQNQILDGRNRYLACQELGIEPSFRRFSGDEEQALQAVLSWNLERRHLSSSQKASLWDEIEPLFQEFERLAKERQAEYHGNQHESGLVEIFPQVQTSEPAERKTRTKVAKVLGTNPKYVDAAKKLKKKSPKLHDHVKKGDVTIPQAKDIAALPEEKQEEVMAIVEQVDDDEEKRSVIRSAIAQAKREERLEALEEISRGNDDLASDIKYPVLYADPPWRYEHVKTGSRAIENQYPTMTLEDICGLPVPEITTDDAILFLWTTAPKLEESFKVLNEWGFSYRSCAIWDKGKIGMGYYFRVQHEILLIAVKGSIPTPPPGERVSSLVALPNGDHSVKPEYFAELIEKWYPNLPKLELFSRSLREGWDAWGNQANG